MEPFVAPEKAQAFLLLSPHSPFRAIILSVQYRKCFVLRIS
jgi:hypothetical protein